MLATLRQQLAHVLEPPMHGGTGLPTGVEELDAVLASGGVPRGRLTEILGIRSSGKTTVLRRLVEETVLTGDWVAYIDAARTLAPRDWAHLGERERVWMIRPTDPARGAWCADVLLRSGAFALVVLDGATILTRSVAVRLTRLARESSAAFVVVGNDHGGTATMLGGALRLRLAEGRAGRPMGRRTRADRWRRGMPNDEDEEVYPAQEAVRHLLIAVEKGGVSRTVEVSCAIGVARRLCSHPEVPDRRGVARRPARTGDDGSGRGDPAAVAAAPEPRQLSRKRRCAEPEFGRERSALCSLPAPHTDGLHPSRAAARGRALG